LEKERMMLNEATFVVFGVVRKVEQGGNGRKWLRLTIPVDRSYTDNDRKVERTTWFEAVCFRPKLIEVITRLNVEGRRVRLCGDIEITQRAFEGRKIKETSFLIDSLDLIDSKPHDGSGENK
jgi:single-stranded DNA-binding protein